MHDDVKLAVDNGDKVSLKYIFCDCLDGDPTFEKYQEDYDYCVRNNALFEAHRELHSMETSNVDEEYWVQLKSDFMENPSKERLAHMREVAKILYKDRIARIQAERDAAKRAADKAAEAQWKANVNKATADKAAEAQVQQSITQPDSQPFQNTGNDGIIKAVEKKEPTSYNASSQNQHTQNGTSSKKDSGAGCILPLLVVVAIIIIVVLIVKNH